MKDQNFFEISGHKIAFVEKNGKNFFPLKQFCEQMEVDYGRAYRNLQKDHFLKDQIKWVAIETTGKKGENPVATVCLEAHYFYGWVFSLKAKSEAMLEFQRECNRLLYEFFSPAARGINVNPN